VYIYIFFYIYNYIHFIYLYFVFFKSCIEKIKLCIFLMLRDQNIESLYNIFLYKNTYRLFLRKIAQPAINSFFILKLLQFCHRPFLLYFSWPLEHGQSVAGESDIFAKSRYISTKNATCRRYVKTSLSN